MLVAAVQFQPVFKDIKANLQTMTTLVVQAVQAGAELIVFPELATTGYSFGSPDEARLVSEFLIPSEPLPHPSLDLMMAHSKHHGVAIVWGLVERMSGDTLFNSQCLVTPEGKLATYRKRNLWGSDFWWATPGDASPTIVEWRGRKIGLLICRDIRNKNDVVDDIYEPGDADIVAFSANFGVGGVPAVAWVNFAKNNKVALIVSNRYGEEYGDETYNNFGKGGICIVGSEGQCTKKGFKLAAPCIVVADV